MEHYSINPEVTFPSKAEILLARSARKLLSKVALNEIVEESTELREMLSPLERFVEVVLAEIHHEWNFQSLDGIDPEVTRKIGSNAVELIGWCVMFGTWAWKPIHVCFQADNERDEIIWMECKLDECRPGSKRTHSRFPIAGQVYSMDWKYDVGFGARVEPSNDCLGA